MRCGVLASITPSPSLSPQTPDHSDYSIPTHTPHTLPAGIAPARMGLCQQPLDFPMSQVRAVIWCEWW